MKTIITAALIVCGLAAHSQDWYTKDGDSLVAHYYESNLSPGFVPPIVLKGEINNLQHVIISQSERVSTLEKRIKELYDLHRNYMDKKNGLPIEDYTDLVFKTEMEMKVITLLTKNGM